jgi:hypothetical protein
VIVPFTDQRSITNRCGIRKNAGGSEVGDVQCPSDPATWVALLLRNQLRQAGFTVISDSTDSPNTLVIRGALLTLFVEPIGYGMLIDTDISVRLVASSQTGLRAERQFFVKKTQQPADARTEELYQDCFNRAVERIAYDMASAILLLMNRYPELGAS